MKKWEYLKLRFATEDELQKLGKDGWELVAAQPTRLYFRRNRRIEQRQRKRSK